MKALGDTCSRCGDSTLASAVLRLKGKRVVLCLERCLNPWNARKVEAVENALEEYLREPPTE